MTSASLSLLPPRRLGALLGERREATGRTLDEIAAASTFTVADLAAIEAGEGPLDGDELEAVLAAYGMQAEDLVPQRAQVVVDLDRGELLVAEQAAALDRSAPTADEVLGAYLSLVYTLRHARPGTPLVMRQFDVSVLARSLRLAEPEVQRRLEGLMVAPTTDLSVLHRRLSRKLVVPLVGAVVVIGALGTVLVLRADDTSAPTPSTTTRPGAIEVPVDSEASILPPISITREGADTPAGP
jgi:transcriptional regulator with XRE-family HTH domain